MELALALGVLLTSLSVTYLCCIRPMRRGDDVAGAPGVRSQRRADRDEQIARLRTEVSELRDGQPHSRSRATWASRTDHA